MKQKLIIFLAVLICSAVSFAAPAWPDSVLVHQPDGSDLWVYDRGDEFFSWVASTDGYVIVRNRSGVFEYATINNGHIQASGIKVHNVQTKGKEEYNYAKKQQKDIREKQELTCSSLCPLRLPHIPLSPVIGTRKILTILIQFSDKPLTYSVANFDSIMNYVGYSSHSNAGSVRDYYYANSYEQLTLQSTVIGPYTATQPSSYYQYIPGGNVSNARSLATDAIDWADSQGIDFSTYDGDNDGFVDCIHIVFAGNRYSASGNGIIWPFTANFPSVITKDGKQIAEYMMTPEKRGDIETNIDNIGTICHELGHILGAPDFYPVGVGPAGRQFLGTGKWDVMGTGCYNGKKNGNAPAHHNPYTKTTIFKWTTPNTISATEKNIVYNVATSSQAETEIYKISTATEGEFYLLENRQKVYFDSCLVDSGLLIYHIHSDIESAIAIDSVNSYLPQKCYLVDPLASQNIPTSDTSSYGVPDWNIFPYSSLYEGNTNIFFSSQTTPRSQDWSGTATGVDVCFIQHNGSNMKFVVNPQIEGPDTLRLHGVPDSAWYHIRNVPSGATITWSITNQQGGTLQLYLNSPQGRDSILVKFGYNGLPPTPPSPYTGIYDSISTNLIPPSGSYHRGNLSVTISTGSGSNSDSYTLNKTIRRRMTNLMNPSLACNVNGNTLNVVVGDNQIATDNSANYTLELWNSIYGLMRTKVAQSATEQMSTTGLPQGVYVILLKENGNVIAETKVIVQ